MTPQEHARLARILYESLTRTKHLVSRNTFESIVSDHVQRAIDEAKREQMERDCQIASEWPEHHQSLRGWMPDEAAGSIAIAIRVAFDKVASPGVKLPESKLADGDPDVLPGTAAVPDAGGALTDAAEHVQHFITDIMKAGDCGYFNPENEPGRTMYKRLTDALAAQRAAPLLDAVAVDRCEHGFESSCPEGCN